MALIVHKYGGTSMGSTERIRNVAKRVAKWVRAGHQIVVVPSAMSGETNRLLGLAKELSDSPSPRELDMIASTGEQVSATPSAEDQRATIAQELRTPRPRIAIIGTPGQMRTIVVHGETRPARISVVALRRMVDVRIGSGENGGRRVRCRAAAHRSHPHGGEPHRPARRRP